jgi:hypothetical protein
VNGTFSKEADVRRKRSIFIVVMATVLICAAWLTGCSVLGIAAKLPSAISGHTDPDTVREAMPAYLTLADAMVLDDPNDEDTLLAAAKLYLAFGAIFVDGGERLTRLSQRALNYSARALCEEAEQTCGITSKPLDEIERIVMTLDEDDVERLHVFAGSWLLWISSKSDDWGAIAQIPKATRAVERVVELDDGFDGGSAHLYLGILHTLRPPALGGDTEKGRYHFEHAIELGEGKNLAAKVQYAQRYARLVFDRDLHDRLLREVLESPVEAEGFTLSNILAKKRAEELLASADDYF